MGGAAAQPPDETPAELPELPIPLAYGEPLGTAPLFAKPLLEFMGAGIPVVAPLAGPPGPTITLPDPPAPPYADPPATAKPDVPKEAPADAPPADAPLVAPLYTPPVMSPD
jgi:hypothetical protein